MLKTIPIPTDERKFFRQYLELTAPLLKLRDKERKVLAEFLYYNYKYRSIEDDNERFALVFSTITRKKVIDTLNINEAILNNNLSELRKKGYIIDNRIKKFYCINPIDNDILTYRFKF